MRIYSLHSYRSPTRSYAFMSTPFFNTNQTYCLKFDYSVLESERYLAYHTAPGLQIYIRSKSYELSGRKIWSYNGLQNRTVSIQVWKDPLQKQSQVDFVGFFGDDPSSTEIEISNVGFREGNCENILLIECLDGNFQCHDRKECIPVEGVCNGTSECADSSDEEPPACGEFASSLLELPYRCY